MLNRSVGLIVLCAAMLAAALPAKAQESRTGNHVMWSPVEIEKRDLYQGPGGAAMRPNLRRVTLIRKESGGNNLKYRIKDASGRVWVVKIADESQPEVAAVRLLYGIGYRTEINYIAPRLRIPSVGTFRNASLEARPANVKREDRWSWKENPFVGTRELQGLKIMMALINNWDIKDGNNIILSRDGERHYVISDSGSSFGKMAVSSKFLLNRIGRSVNEPVGYVNTEFIKGVDQNGMIDFAYKGKAAGMLDDISVDDARWLAGLLLRLSTKQIDDAFRAANYTPSQRRLLVREVRERIRALAAPVSMLEEET
jgi:hypothetical protein